MRLTSEFLVVNIDRALVSAIVVSDWRGRISQFCSQRWKGQQIVFDISGFTIGEKCIHIHVQYPCKHKKINFTGKLVLKTNHTEKGF